LQRALRVQPDLMQALEALAELKFAGGDYISARKYFASYAQKNENLTASQLWLAVRIERRVGDGDAEASYALQLRQRYPDARETQLLMHGE
jgi:type IV pilus assembly protein PilF